MYELIQVAPHTYYIQSPAKIGVVETSDGHVVLIDSGNDKEAGRKVRQYLDRRAGRLTPSTTPTPTPTTSAATLISPSRPAAPSMRQASRLHSPSIRSSNQHCSTAAIR